jgi:3-oxoacyl-[acyl-carrier protein] reductase|tara:strand:+ start:808 stop:1548 length:741 start_codon:yes stop_codon:yes gene_type:complete
MLKGKNAVITGCNRGIGKSILEVFAQNGAHIWACLRKKDTEFLNFIESLSDKNNVLIQPIYFDLSNYDELKNAALEINNDSKPVDILVNNAGIIHVSLFQMTPINKIKENFDVNFFSQMFFTQYLVKGMIKNKKGSIVNISSSSAIEANIGRIAYAASKSSLITASKVIANELGKFNIRVNAIAPGLTDTDMMKNSTSIPVLNETIKRIPLGRIAKPLEIANVVLFLSSDLSSYITGQVLRVDGGM